MRKTPELDLQEQVCAFLRVATIPPARFWHVPNGANLSKAQRGRLKEAGLTPGIADLHFIWRAGSGFAGSSFFGTIELKAGRGKLTTEQEDFSRDMLEIGHRWAECRSLDQVIATLLDWGYPLRSHTIQP